MVSIIDSRLLVLSLHAVLLRDLLMESIDDVHSIRIGREAVRCMCRSGYRHHCQESDHQPTFRSHDILLLAYVCAAGFSRVP